MFHRRGPSARSAFCGVPGSCCCSSHSDVWNAYLRRVHGETVVITHPCHPLAGQRVDVIHYCPDGAVPSVVIELPDQSLQCLPVRWTDRCVPEWYAANASEGSRLSAPALLEVVKWLEKWKDEAGQTLEKSGTV